MKTKRGFTLVELLVVNQHNGEHCQHVLRFDRVGKFDYHYFIGALPPVAVA
ncbi:MAG: type II secretion system protein [Limisphaerales bacterium]